MIQCEFEDGGKANPGLRHVTVNAIALNDKNDVLLIKRSTKYSRGNKYSTPGGFLDRDGDTKQAVLKELKEETGYDGEVLMLFQINDNPNRPKEDRQNVDFNYIVKIIGGEKRIDNDEVIEVDWFSKDNLPSDEEFAFDHRAIILRYFDYMQKQFPLPVIGPAI